MSYVIHAAEYKRLPWKNGGGQTTEVAISPAAAGFENFGWRISLATVPSSGPFSVFPGIDRTLSVIGRHPLRLSIDGQSEVTLNRESSPFAFSGDAAAYAFLEDGEVQDLNVMSRRSCYTHRMTRHRLSTPLSLRVKGEAIVLLPRLADVEVKIGKISTIIRDGDTFILDGSNGEIIDIASCRPADIYLVEFRRCGETS